MAGERAGRIVGRANIKHARVGSRGQHGFHIVRVGFRQVELSPPWHRWHWRRSFRLRIRDRRSRSCAAAKRKRPPRDAEARSIRDRREPVPASGLPFPPASSPDRRSARRNNGRPAGRSRLPPRAPKQLGPSGFSFESILIASFGKLCTRRAPASVRSRCARPARPMRAADRLRNERRDAEGRLRSLSLAGHRSPRAGNLTAKSGQVLRYPQARTDAQVTALVFGAAVSFTGCRVSLIEIVRYFANNCLTVSHIVVEISSHAGGLRLRRTGRFCLSADLEGLGQKQITDRRWLQFDRPFVILAPPASMSPALCANKPSPRYADGIRRLLRSQRLRSPVSRCHIVSARVRISAIGSRRRHIIGDLGELEYSGIALESGLIVAAHAARRFAMLSVAVGSSGRRKSRPQKVLARLPRTLPWAINAVARLSSAV